jgi:RpiR family carbohydrate utilization transcriptional regulator
VSSEQAETNESKDDLMLRLQRSYATLRKSEQRVADYLRANLGVRLDFSITDFAKKLEVSEATISRFCRAIGYSGFQDLKLSVAESSRPVSAFKNIPTDINENDGFSDICQKMAGALSQGIINTQISLNPDTIEEAVKMISKAKRIVIAGVGGAAAVAAEANHLFVKAGLNSAAYNDGYMQMASASLSSASSVMIGISHTGATLSIANALGVAREKGASTIAITSNPGSPVGRNAEICLLTAPNVADKPLYGDFMEGRANQLYIVDLLYLGMLFTLGDKAKKSLKESTRLLERHYGRKITE